MPDRDGDEHTARFGLARVEWQLGQLQGDVKELKARVMAIYDQGVLLRVVDLENKVAAIERAKSRDTEERGKERRGNWAQVGFLIGGVVLGVLSTFIRSPK